MADTPCLHRWIISTPTQGVSRGVCKFCGAERDYPSEFDRALVSGRRPAWQRGKSPHPFTLSRPSSPDGDA
jgi:hypothetical protein